MADVFAGVLVAVEQVVLADRAARTGQRVVHTHQLGGLCVIRRIAASNGKDRAAAVIALNSAAQFGRHFVRSIGAAGDAGYIDDGVCDIVSGAEDQRAVGVFSHVGDADDAVGDAAAPAISLRTHAVQRADDVGAEVLRTVKKAVKSAGTVKITGRYGIGADHRPENGLVIAVGADGRHVDEIGLAVRSRRDVDPAHRPREGMGTDLDAAGARVGIGAHGDAAGDARRIVRGIGRM